METIYFRTNNSFFIFPSFIPFSKDFKKKITNQKIFIFFLINKLVNYFKWFKSSKSFYFGELGLSKTSLNNCNNKKIYLISHFWYVFFRSSVVFFDKILIFPFLKIENYFCIKTILNSLSWIFLFLCFSYLTLSESFKSSRNTLEIF